MVTFLQFYVSGFIFRIDVIQYLQNIQVQEECQYEILFFL